MNKRIEIFAFFLFFAIIMMPLSMEIVPGISVYSFDFPLALLYLCLYLRVCFRQTRLAFGALDLVFLAFYVWLFVASFFGKDFDISVNYLLFWLRGYVIIFYMRHTVGSFIPEKVFFYSIGFCLLVEPTLAIYQSITQSGLGVVKQYFGVVKEYRSSWVISGESAIRAQGTLDHTNYLANWLVMLLPFLQTRTMTSRGKFRPAFVLWWFTGIVVLILTFSRASWIAFLLGAAVVIYYEHRFRNPWAGGRPWFVYLLIPTLILILCYTFFTTAFEALSELMIARIGRTFADQSYDIRSDLIVGAMNVMKGNFWMGVGLGNSNATIWESNPFIPRWFRATVHNIYLIVATEAGIIGGIFFAVIMLWPFFKILRMLRRCKQNLPKETIDNAIGFLGGFAGLHFAMLWYVGMLNSCEWPLIMTLFGSALGASSCALRRSKIVEEKAFCSSSEDYRLAEVTT